jgi:predicted phosphodiesterase
MSSVKQAMIKDLKELEDTQGKRISRDYYRQNGGFTDYVWTSVFGTFAEFRKQAGLDPSRGVDRLARTIATHASLDVYRNFYEIEVAPWVGKYEKPTDSKVVTLLVGSDLHDKEVDPFVLSVFIDTAKRIQPDVIVLNGDFIDNYEFSRFDKDPRLMDLKGRLDFLRVEVFGPLRKACPDAQIDLMLGNHEHRLLKHLADKTPYMKLLLSDLMGLTLADLFGLPEYQINLVSKWDLAAWRPGDVRDEARKNFKVYFDCFVCNHTGNEGFGLSGTSGHTHRPDVKTSASVHGPLIWTTTGCMCKTNAEYVTVLEKWQNSFLMVHIDTAKKEVIPEHILFSDNMAVVGGKFYFRN